MSVASFERELLYEARLVLRNPKARLKDMMEWNTKEIKPHDGEVVVRLEQSNVWAAFPISCDKRAALKEKPND